MGLLLHSFSSPYTSPWLEPIPFNTYPISCYPPQGGEFNIACHFLSFHEQFWGHEPLNEKIFARPDQCPGVDKRKIEEISLREINKISRVEIFNSHTGKSVQIAVRHVLRYKNAGLRDQHLSELVDLLKCPDSSLEYELLNLYENVLKKHPNLKKRGLFNKMKETLIKKKPPPKPKKVIEISDKIQARNETCDCYHHGDSRPFALYLRSNQGKPVKDSFITNPKFYERHSFCVRTLESFYSICDHIKKYAKMKIDTLITSSHSNRKKGSQLAAQNPDLSCLRDDLPKNATIILEGCENGWGGDREQNLANVIANAAHDETTIFASREKHRETGIRRSHPWDVEYHTDYGEDITYKIEPKTASCTRNSSFLDRCKRFILLGQEP